MQTPITARYLPISTTRELASWPSNPEKDRVHTMFAARASHWKQTHRAAGFPYGPAALSSLLSNMFFRLPPRAGIFRE